MSEKFCVVLITAPTVEEGRKLARGLLEEKHAACVNLVGNIESSYWWEGKVESASEVLLLVKTATSKVNEIEAWVKAHHTYSVPEIIALPIVKGSKRYLDWIGDSLT